jgi:hypothetical protein
MVNKVNQEVLQPKMIADLTMLDPNQLPDSPSHLFAGKSDPKPEESDESIVVRSSQAVGSVSSAFASVRNAATLSISQSMDYTMSAAAAESKQPVFNGSACNVSVNQQSANPDPANVTRTLASVTICLLCFVDSIVASSCTGRPMFLLVTNLECLT